MRHEIISPTYTLFKNEKKNGESLGIPKSYDGLFIGMFLPIYAMYYKTRAYGQLFRTDAHSVINSDKEINMVSNCCENYEEYPVINYFAFGHDERKLAKLRVCAIFYEMLIIA